MTFLARQLEIEPHWPKSFVYLTLPVFDIASSAAVAESLAPLETEYWPEWNSCTFPWYLFPEIWREALWLSAGVHVQWYVATHFSLSQIPLIPVLEKTRKRKVCLFEEFASAASVNFQWYSQPTFSCQKYHYVACRPARSEEPPWQWSFSGKEVLAEWESRSPTHWCMVLRGDDGPLWLVIEMEEWKSNCYCNCDRADPRNEE